MSGEAVEEPVEPSERAVHAAPEHAPAPPGAPPQGGEAEARTGVAEAVVPAGPPPEPTGDPRVDLVLQRLTELGGAPVSRHVAVFEDVHQRLQDLLASADEPEDAGPPVPRPPGPRPPMPRPPGAGAVPPRGGAPARGGRP
ncbi:hypothetical protein Acsp04_19810 [Actinomadura sp. NBRC 104425]|uniref:hypothetical protein n=1 Tax=Actinomadura sp. NBRC 104425 TaxID=3032204 RepID=UPI0024A19D64|nr:hypothetical protein [Actinomadura sp. NBRC 104425]GLZ11746.1 hypothetical protein Acsp04_19810 [Actinomadura sp. NBRC 104425]